MPQQTGLSQDEAQARLKKSGYNELPAAKPKTILQIVLEVVKEPMFVLLVTCGILYMLLGDYREGSIMLASILVIISITFYQSQKTERALDALKQMSAPRALVIRDGIQSRIPGREVVPGDLLVLNEGDRVAADATIVDMVSLAVDESMLTGESVAVNKSAANNDLCVFSGSLVVQGKAIAEATATGLQTEIGKIGASLENITADSTRLQQEMKKLIRVLFITGAVICICIVAAFYFTRGNFIQSVLNGLAAAISILPEEFPVVLTLFLALGAWRLSRKNILTRKPSAIETLGTTTVLCTDKTGTITQNKMEVAAIFDGHDVYEKNGFHLAPHKLAPLVTAAVHASQKDAVDPMEKAIRQAGHALSLLPATDYSLVKEYPLSADLFAMTRVMQGSDGDTPVAVKGAPEAVFSLCRLPADVQAKYWAVGQELAGRGYRVIAVASAQMPASLPEKQNGFAFSFLGLIAFEDPIRPEVPAAIAECYNAGIKVIMITGDFPATAKSIAVQAGLQADKMVVTGEELNKMDNSTLQKNIGGINIFARVVPEQKLRIVQALKANGEIVAMTGDGVNDAPALKAAHIGIAMGNRGTDVAREASSLVLLDDNFASIVGAIRSGRRIFDNLQKAMSYILAIHIPVIGLTLIPAFVTSMPVLLMPLHIVFLELIIDPVCSIAFESEKEEQGLMQRPPRSPDERFFGWRKIGYSLLQGALLLCMVITVYIITSREGHTANETRAIAFSALITSNILLILTALSKSKSAISVVLEKNIAVVGLLSAAFIVLQLILLVPQLRVLFTIHFPGFKHFIPSLVGSMLLLLVLEAMKFWRLKKLRLK
ncbi:MAG TPA: cation-translocating P-type ATPase [Chitinophagaceae bacterium]|nr:cation-translocating P-type ATPase [Chitinophagaceae bacterium]